MYLPSLSVTSLFTISGSLHSFCGYCLVSFPCYNATLSPPPTSFALLLSNIFLELEAQQYNYIHSALGS